MRSRICIGGLAAVLAVTTVTAQSRFSKVTEIPIGGAGAFDYLNVDSAGKRLYVTHGTEIVVIDMTTNKVVGKIADTPRVHGIAIVPELGKAFTTNGGENKVSVVDLQTLQTLSKIDTWSTSPRTPRWPSGRLHPPNRPLEWRSIDPQSGSSSAADRSW